ncbi:MAG: ABC transporter ATP-binding protein [Candidatus Limnocylindria bacterium]
MATSREEDAPPDDEVFALRGVSLRRSGRTLLADIDWTVRAGERWVVLGPNGAGKTTLVRILSTYARASDGSVRVLRGRIGRTNVHDLHRAIGYLSPSLVAMVPGELTPRQIVNAAQAGALLPWYLDQAALSDGRTDEVLALVDMAEVGDRAFSTFSSGEQLRIQVARSLVNQPHALLLDEPMASLDIGGRESVRSALTRIAAGGIRAIVLVVHRIEDIPRGFTHGLLLREGRIVATGPLDGVLRDAPLSACFGVPLTVSRVGERLTAELAADGQPADPSRSQSIASR